MKDLRLYDSISSTYVSTRRADSRVAAWIHSALGGAERVVNVGAGTGNYEPDDRRVVAVEPSGMIAKRPSIAAPAIRAAAEELPLKSAAFDAALAIFPEDTGDLDVGGVGQPPLATLLHGFHVSPSSALAIVPAPDHCGVSLVVLPMGRATWHRIRGVCLWRRQEAQPTSVALAGGS